MGLDYYSVLGLTRSATDLDIKKSYRKLALKYHPDKDSSEDASSDFERVCEAYDVLSDSAKKGFYDLHGEDALKRGKSDGNGGIKGGTYSFDSARCAQIFTQFFGTNNPYEALEDLTTTFEALTATHQPKPGSKQVHPVQLSLEEIYHGCLKKVTFQRRHIAVDDTMQVEERVLTIDVKPGLPEGTRFVFEGEGNVFPGKTPGPVIFVLETLPHERFHRQGADLKFTATIPLFHALAGTSVKVKMLDEKVVDVPIADIITPGYSHTVKGLGLPSPLGGESTRGDLIIETKLQFPKYLTQAQKMLLKATLFLPADKDDSAAVKDFLRAFEDPLTGWHTGFKL